MNLICWLFGHNFQLPAAIQAGGMFIYEANTGLDPEGLLMLPTEVVIINSGTKVPQVVNPRPMNWVWCKRCAAQANLKLNSSVSSLQERRNQVASLKAAFEEKTGVTQ